jgi:peptidoglycan/LPS O-acetylase OafA/YrhL
VPSAAYLLSLHQSFSQLTRADHEIWALPQSGGFLGVLNFNPIMRLPEFAGGVILGLLFLQRRSRDRSGAPGWMPKLISTCAILLTLGVMAIPNLAPYPFLHNGAFFPLWCLLIYSLACSNLFATSARFPILLTLGEVSYGMYILQQPISNYVKLALLKVGHVSIKGDYPNIAWLMVYLAALTIVSYFSYYRIEAPARSWIRRRLDPVKATQLQEVAS